MRLIRPSHNKNENFIWNLKRRSASTEKRFEYRIILNLEPGFILSKVSPAGLLFRVGEGFYFEVALISNKAKKMEEKTTKKLISGVFRFLPPARLTKASESGTQDKSRLMAV